MMASDFISANPDDDFISDREHQWRKYAKGMEAHRDRLHAEIASLRAEINELRERSASQADRECQFRSEQ